MNLLKDALIGWAIVFALIALSGLNMWVFKKTGKDCMDIIFGIVVGAVGLFLLTMPLACVGHLIRVGQLP